MSIAEQTRRRRRLSESASPQEFTETPQVAAPVRHPISRWYLIPFARVVVAGLALSPLTRNRIRPSHITLTGLGFAAAAAGVLLCLEAGAIAAVFVLVAWFCDRADGMLARLQSAGSAWGGWLDSNIDELVDVAMQAAIAAAAVSLSGSQWPWLLLVAFLAGKYLFMYGLSSEETRRPGRDPALRVADNDSNTRVTTRPTLLRRLYHLPADADVRVHFMFVMLFFGWFTAELALVAIYYNMRWIARYPLVARRLGGSS